MVFVNADFPGPEVKVEVEPKNCDGCAFCVDACPVAALSVAPHEGGRGRIVLVDESVCQGCGVCQATCPKEAIRIPGLSQAELRGYIARALECQQQERQAQD